MVTQGAKKISSYFIGKKNIERKKKALEIKNMTTGEREPHTFGGEATVQAPWGTVSLSVGMRVCSCHGEPYGGSLKTKIELPYDSVIPLLAKDLEITLVSKDIHTPVFTAAKTWEA